MAGDDEDVLIEIDRILAGENEEPEATEAEPETDEGEAEAEDDSGGEAPLPDFDFGGDGDGEAAEPDDAGDVPVATGAPDRIGRTELVAILL